MDEKDDNLIFLMTDFGKKREWVELRPLKCLQQVAHRFELDNNFPINGSLLNCFDKARDLLDDNTQVELNWIFQYKSMNLFKIGRYGKYVLTVTWKNRTYFKVSVHRTDVSPPTVVYTYRKEHEFDSLQVNFDQFHITIWCESWYQKRTLILLDFLPDCK